MGLVELKAAEFYCDKCHTKSRVVHHGMFDRPKLPPGWSAETVVIHGDYPAYDESKDLYYCKLCTDAAQVKELVGADDDGGEVMNNSDNKKWWIGSERDGWEEATYPFSPTPVFGWNPEEGYYGRVFTTDDDRESTINALINIFSSARYCFDADDDAGER